MIPRVNYLIACSSHRVNRIDSSGSLGKDALRNHLQELAKTNTSRLAQVTIIRALPLTRNDDAAFYWDIEEASKGIVCPIKTLDVQDRYFSYSSWMHAVRKYRNEFDYYIMIEDDYYPSLPNFVDELIRIHTEKLPNGGYLNSFTTDIAAVSNGICDTKTILECVDSYRDPIEELAGGSQNLFGKVCFNNKLADYTDQYRTLFWGGPGMVNETHDLSLNLTTDIFRPIQYLRLGEVIF